MATNDDYESRGLVVLTVASQDASPSRAPVDAADVSDWVAYFAIDFPVLADPTASVAPLYAPNPSARPYYVLLAPGAEIVEIGAHGSITDADIEAVLP